MSRLMRRVGLLFNLVFFLLMATACGDSGTSESSLDEPAQKTEVGSGEAEEGALSGSVVIDGSGTVYPFMAMMAEKYMSEHPDVSVEVGRAGTSAGFQKFLVENGTDFNDASRKIKDEELALAEELGIEVKELKVALDGLTIVVHPENEWATELTKEEVAQIFLTEGGIKSWSDVRPEFPDEPINKYGPNENHGTYEFFWEVILEEKELDPEINLHQEYATLVDLIANDPHSIGFFGYGYYANNQDRIKAVHIDFGEGPVAPSLETIAEDEEYAPFTRPVFTYLNVNHAQEKPPVLDYAIYILEHAAQIASETGFVPVSEEEIQQMIIELESLK